ncbi:MAG: TIGR04222 domain-containing membrane protein, partial [Reyranellaceae bacterium]
MIKLLVDYYFLILVLLAVAGFFVAQRLMGVGAAPAPNAPPFDYRDPYLIAALRGGPRAVIELAIVALLDRGLLQPDDARFDDKAHIKASREDAVEFAGNDVERALLACAASKTAIRHVLSAVEVKAAAEAYAKRLIALGLKLDEAAASRRRAILVLCLLPVAVVVILRVVLPKHVSIFHVVLGLSVLLMTGAIARAKRDERGKAILKELTDLFAGLAVRAAELRRGRMSSDAV